MAGFTKAHVRSLSLPNSVVLALLDKERTIDSLVKFHRRHKFQQILTRKSCPTCLSIFQEDDELVTELTCVGVMTKCNQEPPAWFYLVVSLWPHFLIDNFHQAIECLHR